MANIEVTKHRSEDPTAQTPGPPVQGPVTGQVTEHHLLTYHISPYIDQYFNDRILI